MDPYQAWRRGLITYSTYLRQQLEDNIDLAEDPTDPIDPGDYDVIIASTVTLIGDATIVAPDGVLVASAGTLVISDPVTLTINPA